MGGGDKTAEHHCIRDDIYAQAKRGNTAPVLEAGGIMNVLGRPGDTGPGVSRERPADVLLCRAQDIRVGRGNGGAAGRVALDVGVVCSQAASHLGAAAREVLGAAEEYARTKCSRQEVEERCRQAGVVFQPMIFDSLGGVSSEADRVIKSLNQAVAENTDSPIGEIATRFWQRISIDMQRAGHRAFSGRSGSAGSSLGAEAGFLIRAAGALEVPGGL